MSPLIPILVGLVVLVGIVIVVRGLRKGPTKDPIQARLEEFGALDHPVSLEELELSLPFTQRIVRPLVENVIKLASQLTPSKSVEAIQHNIDLAGNPYNLTPTTFTGLRIGGVIVLGGILLAVTLIFRRPFLQVVGLSLLGAAIGFVFPTIWLTGQIRNRKNSIIKALPDALDLLTVAVEAGLGFDAALTKVAEKWDNQLSVAFGRVIQEIQLGKLRREALRNMAYRMEVPDVTTFVAAIVQAEELGVSIAKVLRIQSDQMRVRRRQRAEELAHQATVKVMLPVAFMIFPSLFIVLLGPAALTMLTSNTPLF